MTLESGRAMAKCSALKSLRGILTFRLPVEVHLKREPLVHTKKRTYLERCQPPGSICSDIPSRGAQAAARSLGKKGLHSPPPLLFHSCRRLPPPLPLPSPLPCQRFPFSARAHGGPPHGERSGGRLLVQVARAVWSIPVLRWLIKLGLGAALLAAAAVAALPALLSWPAGRGLVLGYYNQTIPGTLTIQSASLQWNRPVLVSGIRLEGPNGKPVLAVRSIETEAPLWSLVLRGGLAGGTSVVSMEINLLLDGATGLTSFDRALRRPEEALSARALAKAASLSSASRRPPAPAEVRFSVHVEAPRGSLQVVDGRATVPADTASVLGDVVFLKGRVGRNATAVDPGLGGFARSRRREVPVRADLSSDVAHMEAAGTMRFSRGGPVVHLARPMKAEMDLTPAVGRLFLGRLNPLLADVMGPAAGRPSMPDVVVHATPVGLALPSEDYHLRVEPMHVVLARGSLVNGLLSLVTRHPAPAGEPLTMRTSAINADAHPGGALDCQRMDVLIGGGLHVAAWGLMDPQHDTCQMTLALPSDTLRHFLGLSRLPENFALQIPLKGPYSQPRVDWRAAGLSVGELLMHQRTGVTLSQLFPDAVTASLQPAPAPPEPLPWAAAGALR